LLKELAFFAQDDGTDIFPSVKTLAGYLGCSERAVQKHLRELEAEGFIRTLSDNAGGWHRTNTYQMNLEILPPLPAKGVNGVHPCENSSGSRNTAEPSVHPGVNGMQERVHAVQKKGERSSPNRQERLERHEIDSANQNRPQSGNLDMSNDLTSFLSGNALETAKPGARREELRRQVEWLNSARGPR
jgi:hypothetical protein